jgi:hypothetical protein
VHPDSIPGLFEVTTDGDIVLYISPSLIRKRAQREAEQKRREAEDNEERER